MTGLLSHEHDAYPRDMTGSGRGAPRPRLMPIGRHARRLRELPER